MPPPPVTTPSPAGACLRPIAAVEAAVMADLHAKAFNEPWDSPWDAVAIARLLDLDTVAGLAAWPARDGDIRDGGTWDVGTDAPTGMVLIQAAAGEAEILTIAVDPRARRQGLGLLLLDGAAIWAAAHGAERLLLEVAADNPAARGLYQKAGFTTVGRRRGYYARGKQVPADAEVMALALTVDDAPVQIS
ncbi:N-acetyltransferase [Tistrella bauzanensis]|nr:N-acetyltransferase [Tistrella bauzanensis]